MKDEELARYVHGMARRFPMVNHQENEALKEAAQRLMQLTAPVVPRRYALPEFDGLPGWRYACGACESPIDLGDRYCRRCGKAVKWDD